MFIIIGLLDQMHGQPHNKDSICQKASHRKPRKKKQKKSNNNDSKTHRTKTHLAVQATSHLWGLVRNKRLRL